MDIIFALGSSDPNGVRIFEQEKALTNHLINQQISATTRYGVITYSNISRTRIPMQSSTDVYRLQDRVGSLKWPGVGSGVDKALTQANSVFKNSKPGARKVLVIFMSGRASAPLSTLREAVKPLLNQGVRVVLIGYGNQLDDGQLSAISENTRNLVVPSGDDDSDGYKITLALLKGRIS